MDLLFRCELNKRDRHVRYVCRNPFAMFVTEPLLFGSFSNKGRVNTPRHDERTATRILVGYVKT